MIFEGIKLAIIGIFFVYIFLSLLVWVMHLSAVILRRYTQQEERELAVHQKRASTSAFLKDGRLVAAIGAAIAVHRRRARRRMELRG
jgi:sodium pump decarboxylase gamma subunit